MVLAFLQQNVRLRIISTAIVALLFIIGLRPMVPSGGPTVYQNNLDVIFVVDNTLSMLAEDYQGTGRRVDAVLNDIEYLINKLPGSYYSLISFANDSKINLRLTVDGNAAITAIKTLHQIDYYYARGSTVTVFKKGLEDILKASAKKSNRRRVVFVFSDGENTAKDAKNESLSSLKQFIDGGAVLGYGTTSGGKMQVPEYTGSEEYNYLEDRSTDYPWSAAISRIDESNLNKMASELGVPYIHAVSPESLYTVANDILGNPELSGETIEQNYGDIYYYFAALLLVLMLTWLYVVRKEYL